MFIVQATLTNVNKKFISMTKITKVLLYNHKRFTGKYTTRKIHSKLNLELGCQIFHILSLVKNNKKKYCF